MIHVRTLGRDSAWVAGRGSIAGTVAAVALFGMLLQPVQAAEQSYADACQDAWDDAPAQQYCTSTQVAAVGAGTGIGNCLIDVSTCSITVRVVETDTTFTPTWPTSYGNTGDGLSASDTETIDICFASSTSEDSGYTATVKAGCASDETGSASATTDGLD